MEYASRNIFLGVAGKKARQGARVSGYDCALSLFYETQHIPLLSVKCCRVSTVTRYSKTVFAYESLVPTRPRTKAVQRSTHATYCGIHAQGLSGAPVFTPTATYTVLSEVN